MAPGRQSTAWPCRRRRKRGLGTRLLQAGVLVVILLARTTPGAAFELLRVSNDPCDNTSRNLAWPAARAPVNVQPLTAVGLAGLATTAWERWNESVCCFRFFPGGGTPCDLGDGIVTVAFSSTDCRGNRLGDVVAVTTNRWSSDGRLLDAEIVVNPNSVARTNEAVFLEVVLHELGHVLGLDHSDACGQPGTGTLMKSVLALSQPRLDRPQADDIAGANFIYGSGDGSAEVPEGANSCAVAPPRSSGCGIWLLIVPAGLLLRRMVRRDFAVDEQDPLF